MFQIGVRRNYRRQGIAGGLISCILGQAKQRGFEKVIAECTGPVSRHTCERCGFRTAAYVAYDEFQRPGILSRTPRGNLAGDPGCVRSGRAGDEYPFISSDACFSGGRPAQSHFSSSIFHDREGTDDGGVVTLVGRRVEEGQG